jgi:hypothetical protein
VSGAKGVNLFLWNLFRVWHLFRFDLGQGEKAKRDLARGVALDPDYNVRDFLRPLLPEIQAETGGE